MTVEPPTGTGRPVACQRTSPSQHASSTTSEGARHDHSTTTRTRAVSAGTRADHARTSARGPLSTGSGPGPTPGADSGARSRAGPRAVPHARATADSRPRPGPATTPGPDAVLDRPRRRAGSTGGPALRNAVQEGTHFRVEGVGRFQLSQVPDVGNHHKF